MSADISLRFNDAIKSDMENAVLCWLATVDEEGMPNVSPKELFTPVGDDRIIIADVASPQSVRNISHNPRVCVSFIDVFRQRGFKLKGNAVVLRNGSTDFAAVAKPLVEMAGPSFPVKSVIVVTVTKIARIWAPSYAIFPDRTEPERMAEAYRTYGVMPA